MFGAFGQPGEHFKTACKNLFMGACGHIATAVKSLGQAMNFHLGAAENVLYPNNNLRGILDKNVQQLNATNH